MYLKIFNIVLPFFVSAQCIFWIFRRYSNHVAYPNHNIMVFALLNHQNIWNFYIVHKIVKSPLIPYAHLDKNQGYFIVVFDIRWKNANFFCQNGHDAFNVGGFLRQGVLD